MISITGQNTGNKRDPKPIENACHRRFTSPKTSWKTNQINGHGNSAKRQLSVNEQCRKVDTHAAILFPVNALPSQGVLNMSRWGRSHRIWQVFSKHSDHSGYWWVAPKFLVSTFQLVGIFTPRKRVGFGRDSFLPFQSFMEPAHHP